MHLTAKKFTSRWQTSEKKEDILQNRLIKFKELLSAKF
jgi:hypothetical protein